MLEALQALKAARDLSANITLPNMINPLSIKILITSQVCGIGGRLLENLSENKTLKNRDSKYRFQRNAAISAGLAFGAHASSIYFTESKFSAAMLLLSSTALGLTGFVAAAYYHYADTSNNSMKTLLDFVLEDLPENIRGKMKREPHIMLAGAIGAVIGACGVATLISR
jgi:hypothetical protein